MRHGYLRMSVTTPDKPDLLPAFVAVGASGTTPYYSHDGVTWLAGSGTPTHTMYSGAFGNNAFVFCGDGNNYFVSNDGINFSTIVGVGGAAGGNITNRIGFNKSVNKFFVMRGGLFPASPSIYSSEDGFTWTLVASLSGVSTNYQSDFLVCNNGMAFCDYNGTTSRIWASVDGINWSVRYTEPTAIQIRQGYSTNEKIYFVYSDVGNFISSSDMINWTKTPTNATIAQGQSINEGFTYSNSINRAIYIQYNTSKFIGYSDDDALNWIASDTRAGSSGGRLKWSEKAKCFVYLPTTIANYARSNDGITWAVNTYPLPLAARSLIAR